MKLKQQQILDVNKVIAQLLAGRKKSDKAVQVSIIYLWDIWMISGQRFLFYF